MSSEPGYSVRRIPGGMRGTRLTLDEIKRQIIEGSRTWDVRQAALEACNGLRDKNNLRQISAVYDWVKYNCPFRHDPTAMEMIEAPDRAVREIRKGYGFGTDCDGIVALSGAILESIGHPVQIVLIGTVTPRRYNHVYLEVDDPQTGQWISFDAAEPDLRFGECFAGPLRIGRYKITDQERLKLGQALVTSPGIPGALRRISTGVPSAGTAGRGTVTAFPEPEVEAAGPGLEVPVFRRPKGLALDLTIPGFEEEEEYEIDIAPEALPDEGIELTAPGGEWVDIAEPEPEPEEDIWIDVAEPPADARQAEPEEPPDEGFSVWVAEDPETGESGYSVDIDPARFEGLDLPADLVRELISGIQIGGKRQPGQISLKGGAFVAAVSMMGPEDAANIQAEVTASGGDLSGWLSWISDSWVGRMIRKVLKTVNDALAYILGEETAGTVTWIYTRVLIAVIYWETGGTAGGWAAMLLAEIMVDDIDGIQEYINYKIGQMAWLAKQDIKGIEIPPELLDEFKKLYEMAKTFFDEAVKTIKREIERAWENARELIQEAEETLMPLIEAAGAAGADAFAELSNIREKATAALEETRRRYKNELEEAQASFDEALAAGGQFIQSFEDEQVRKVTVEWLDKLDALETQASEEIIELQKEVADQYRLGVLTLKEAEEKVEELEKGWDAHLESKRKAAEEAIEDTAERAQELKAAGEKAAAELRKIVTHQLEIFFTTDGWEAQQAIELYLSILGREGWKAVTDIIQSEFVDREQISDWRQQLRPWEEHEVIQYESVSQFLNEKGIDRGRLIQKIDEGQALISENISTLVSIATAKADGEAAAYSILYENLNLDMYADRRQQKKLEAIQEMLSKMSPTIKRSFKKAAREGKKTLPADAIGLITDEINDRSPEPLPASELPISPDERPSITEVRTREPISRSKLAIGAATVGLAAGIYLLTRK